MDNYLQILEESLHKKQDILGQIEQFNEEQQEILKAEEVDLEEFDRTVDRKGALIERLTELDEGFESLYGHLRDQLEKEKDKYKVQIERLQQLVKQVTEKSITIQAQEARNKKLVETYFKNAKEALRARRSSSKASLDYYRNMNKTSYVSPQFMDQKK